MLLDRGASSASEIFPQRRPAPITLAYFFCLALLLSQDQKNNRHLTSPYPLKIRASDRATMAATRHFNSES